ncbi:hypothetical protein HG536_0D04680 [Torulaspora globosa]|uniref:Mitochondrial group I intron splicing factor CCM1 n=1 Tax=Torulaspora globosa TaxID=48254 RepID=A0A7G3ZHG0_9SACH|nr:uncharacterized protein HG536_0D04680 [Torulaspora globosa]QLL32946.1 hypothetical protein HG536_0D04680 [Torulaspora globosa]
MIRLRNRNSCFAFRKLYGSSYTFIRTAIIPTRGTANRRKRKIKNVSLYDLSLEGIPESDSKALQFKLKQLQELTRNLREQIKKSDSRTKNGAANVPNGAGKGVDGEDSKAIFNQLISSRTAPSLPSQNGNLSSIIMATEPRTSKKLIPRALRERINDDRFVMACLIDRSHRDWNGIVNKLHSSELKLKDIPMTELKTWLLPRANRLTYENIEKLDQMLLERVDADITKYRIPMYECLFHNLAGLRPAQYGDLVTEKMRRLLERYDASREMASNVPEKYQMSQFILNACISYSSKLLSFEDMNFFLAKFKNDYGITPNKENYTAIIQFYTKKGLKKQAWDAFDTMKFLSKAHEPDVVTYNSVLHLCNVDRDYARAIDLYQEMIDRNLEPTAQTLSILAKTLARASADPVTSENKAESLRLMGWKYIHEIDDKYRTNHKEMPFYYTLEAMMALAAYDGDLGLARALYYKYTTQKYKQLKTKALGRLGERKAWQYALDPQLFNYLLLAYSKYDSGSLPLLMGYEKGMKLRRNVMNSVDYYGRQDGHNEIGARLPMLPIMEMTESWQILSESRALWQFNLEYGGVYNLREEPSNLSEEALKDLSSTAKSLEEFRIGLIQMIARWKTDTVNYSAFNPISLNSFLTIPIKRKDKKEFLLRLNNFCFQQHEFDSVVKQIYDSGLAIQATDQASKDETETRAALHESNLSHALSYIASMRHKLSTNCATYELMLKAAIAFGDVEIGTKAWKDRGKFRKTTAFSSLSKEEKTRRDSDFAALMVSFFAKQGMFADALGIVMTSQRYINWTFSMVKALYTGLLDIEDMRSAEILLEIVNKKSPIAKIEEQIMELEF